MNVLSRPDAIRLLDTPTGIRFHLLPIAAIFVLATLIYLPSVTAYFCGYDDFNEAYRAGYVDLVHPSGMFTTSHFNTSKYRPFNRVLTAFAFYLGKGNPLAFRIRNLAFHLLGVAAIYGFAFLFMRSRSAAFSAALLTALHPLGNQSVVGSTWTNTAAYCMMFCSFLLFVLALEKSGSSRVPRLLGSLLLAGLALFTYEATLVLFLLMALYVLIGSTVGRRAWPGMPFLSATAVGVLVVCLAFFAMRSRFAGGHTEVSSLAAIMANVALYIAALLVPVDILLANTLFDFPLPTELLADPGNIGLIALLGGLVAGSILCFAAGSIFFRWRAKGSGFEIDWRILFLIAAVGATLLPFLVFTEHASETYLYPSTAFLAVLQVLLIYKFVSSKSVRLALVATLVILAGSATFARNERVRACGSIASRIVHQLPLDRFRSGVWNLALSPFPDEPVPYRYGIYSYSGIHTIDPGGAGSASTALELATGNTQVSAEVVDPSRMPQICAADHPCFWVHADGSVEPYHTIFR